MEWGLVLFANAPTWPECRQALEDYPELLTAEADQQLTYWIGQYAFSDDVAVLHRLVQRRELLRACREEGLEATFALLCGDSAYPDLSGMPAETAQAARELSTLEDQPQQMGQRARLASHALAGFARVQHPVLWASLQQQLGIALSEKPEPTDADTEDAVEAFQKAADVFAPDAFPLDWADLQNRLGALYWWRRAGDPNENLVQAIRHYEAALQIYSLETFPEQAAEVHYNLGLAYQGCQAYDPSVTQERSIAHYTAALEVYTAEKHPLEWAAVQLSLGLTYRGRTAGDPAENIERAIDSYQAALQIYTRDTLPDRWAAAQLNLGTAYKLRQIGEPAANADQAIACYEAALQGYSEEHTPQQWAKAQLALGETYIHRENGLPADNLARAVAALEAALRVYDPQSTPSDWTDTQSLLGLAHFQWARTGRMASVEPAIDAFQAALQIVTREADSERWATLQTNLGLAHLMQVFAGYTQHAEAARSCFQAALEVLDRRVSPEEWATAQTSLAAALSHITDEPTQHVETALDHAQQALEVFTLEDFPDGWGSVQKVLGDIYFVRPVGDRSSSLERAIEHYQAALQVRTRAKAAIEWAAVKSSLGTAYVRRLRGLYADNIELAIQHLEQALEVFTPEATPERWAETHNSLGAAYVERGYGNWAENVESAIAHYEAALQVRTRTQFPDRWGRTMNNLADAYRVRRRGDPADNLERAIACCKQALEVRTRQAGPVEWAETQHNLALAYAARIRDNREQNRAQAVECYQQALEVYTARRFPARARGTAHQLGVLLLEMGRWQEAWQALDVALQAGSNLYRATFSESGRRIELDENARVAADAAYCLARLGRVREALEVLESARTRSLAQAMALNEAALALADEAARRRIRAARDALQDLNAESWLPPGTPGRRTEAELEAALQQAYIELDAAIARIQSQLPDLTLSDFSLEEFVCQLDSDTALAMPVVSSVGTAIFVLTGGAAAPESAHVVWCSELTRGSLRNLLVERDAEGKAVAGYLLAYRNDDPTAWAAAIENIGRALWDQLMGPLHRCLQTRGLRRVILIPQGMLHLLPLHAAWYETSTRGRRFFLDEYQTGYAPSGQVLARAWVHKTGNTAEAASPSGLLVNNPTGDLLFAQQEVTNIAPLFVGHAVVLGGASDRGQAVITPDAVLAAIPEADVFHFAGHGAFDWEDPLDSALLCFGGITGYDQDDRPIVRSEPLTLQVILSSLDLRHLRLVVLSACETGLTDIGQAPDEYIGLPAGFLQVGAPAVVSSLWAVDDFSTAILMEAFYRRHRAEGQGIAAALRDAQLWLRDLKRDAVLERVGPARDAARTKAQAGDQNARRLWTRLDALREELQEDYGPDDCPFAHPYYWAAFTASGAA